MARPSGADEAILFAALLNRGTIHTVKEKLASRRRTLDTIGNSDRIETMVIPCVRGECKVRKLQYEIFSFFFHPRLSASENLTNALYNTSTWLALDRAGANNRQGDASAMEMNVE